MNVTPGRTKKGRPLRWVYTRKFFRKGKKRSVTRSSEVSAIKRDVVYLNKNIKGLRRNIERNKKQVEKSLK